MTLTIIVKQKHLMHYENYYEHKCDIQHIMSFAFLLWMTTSKQIEDGIEPRIEPYSHIMIYMKLYYIDNITW